MPHQYALDAARLLDRCRYELQDVIREANLQQSNSLLVGKTAGRTTSLASLECALDETEKLLIDSFVSLLEQERLSCPSSSRIQQLCAFRSTATLTANVDLLVSILEIKKKETRTAATSGDSTSHCYYPERSASDTLLFRLIVALQLCLVRIDDAHLVVTGHRRNNPDVSRSSWMMLPSLAATGSLGLLVCCRAQTPSFSRRNLLKLDNFSADNPLVLALARFGLAVVIASLVRSAWNNVWMSTKLTKSTETIVDWNRQWRVVQSTTHSLTDVPNATELSSATLLQAKQTQKLIEYALREPPKFTLWQSQGELRFLMLKHVMDVFYASVGAAMHVTKGLHPEGSTSFNTGRSEPDWQLTLVTAAASSFYSLIGASRKAAEVTSSSLSARALIQNAWGMVSLPAIKTLSLRASRLLKGAAVAERIEICGVPCFVLSADPAPELAATIVSLNRRHRRNSVHRLCTIDEQLEHDPQTKRMSISKPFAGTVSPYRQRDVIFHLTGGGFFAHIIASDVPYLLDWSSTTGAVVICPEYGLLPDHAFPDALNQVTDVYRSLVEGGAVDMLGFEASRIVVTGESAGGNLAAALCIRLGLYEDDCRSETCSSPVLVNGLGGESQGIRFPDALMLSCPVLNLSLDLSHSRVVGTNDPVLPSGLLSAISDAYVPPHLGISKKNPLASPFFATDSMLRKFPPTLLIASSNDPLLDDSVSFNQRLRSLGIESELRAAENLPHAFLGLGTAGFPEAEEAQQACQMWLGYQFSRHRTRIHSRLDA